VNYDDPPTPRAVVRGLLGGATLVALVALVPVSVAEGHIEWKLVALVFALWGGYGLCDMMLGSVVEPLGRFMEGQLTGGDMPPGAGITIEQETASLERLLAGDTAPPPPPHRAILAGIRLAEIYRTHEHDTAKADALIARLAAQYPDAPELRYVRPPAAR
jgi:hypothetical protein